MKTSMEMNKFYIEGGIAVFETFLEIKLPKHYRNFLLNYEGGRLEPGCFNFADGTLGSRLHHIHSLNSANSYNNLVKQLEVFSGRIPSDYISIADDPFGNKICLAVSGKNYGRVYFWDHEFEHDGDGQPSMSNMNLIATNFEEFLASLFSTP